MTTRKNRAAADAIITARAKEIAQAAIAEVGLENLKAGKPAYSIAEPSRRAVAEAMIAGGYDPNGGGRTRSLRTELHQNLSAQMVDAIYNT